MANCCGYDMMILGPDHETALNFANKLLELGRVYNAYVEDDWDACRNVKVFGSCAWSLEASFNISRQNWDGKPTASKFMDEVEKLDITLEAYAEELGMEFMEHYLIRDGKLICSEECAYYQLDMIDEVFTQEELESIAHEWRFPDVGAMLDLEDDGIIHLGGYECNFDFAPATPRGGVPNTRIVCEIG